MLESLTVADDASEEYLGMQFELTVKMEAIQNTAAALSASDGWNLSDTSEIYKALANYCI